MGINFDQLPDKKPGMVDKGKYLVIISKAEMKVPKDPSGKKPAYLNLALDIKSEDGKKTLGKCYDIISESDSDYIRYKLKRFVQALEIPLSGNIELKDLCKIVSGKKLYADITKDEKEGYAPKNVVDIFSDEIFYPYEEAESTGPINAPDAADAEEDLTANLKY